MKKTYVTLVPSWANFILMPPADDLPVECRGFTMNIRRDLAFPITNILADTATLEDEVTVIALRQVNESDPYADENYYLLRRELDFLRPGTPEQPGYQLIDVSMPKDTSSEALIQTFTKLVEVFPDYCQCLVDTTFGGKPAAFTLLEFLQSAHQLFDGVDIERILYREVQRRYDPEQKRSIDIGWYYTDVSALFHLSSIAGLASGSSNGRDFLRSLLNA